MFINHKEKEFDQAIKTMMVRTCEGIEASDDLKKKIIKRIVEKRGNFSNEKIGGKS